MKRYITRHGQVDLVFAQGESHWYPRGDRGLSALGRKQALLLGKRLRENGFCGLIVSSPYARCLETAEIIAREIDSTILPYAPIHEIFRYATAEEAGRFRGFTLEEIREKYSRIDPKATLPYPWWPDCDEKVYVPEDSELVRARVFKGLSALEEKYSDQEILFVGHGASSSAILKYYQVPRIPHWSRRMLFNCSFSMIDPKNEEEGSIFCDTSHLLYEETTSNQLTREQYDQDGFDQPWKGELRIPEDVHEIRGTKILHIGNTYSKYYPFYCQLIKDIRPDIILHTGDMAAEVEVNKNTTVRYEYNTKIRRLLQVMHHSGARLIIVPGNNDVSEEIRALCPRAEVVEENTRLVLDGVSCRVGHQADRMTFDQSWAFYGHGSTEDERHLSDNAEGKPCRFNAEQGCFVYCLSEEKFFHIPHPKST